MALSFTRRKMLALCGKAALAYPLLGMFSCGGGSGGSHPPPDGGYTGTDDQLLDEIEHAAFQFFWNEASPTTGQIKDRALANGGDTRTLSSIAATGFGLTGLCIADQRGYAARSDIKARVTATLQYLLNQMPNVHGFFYHFVDMNTGERAPGSELSSIDTAILLCGVLSARQYFQDQQITSLATQIYERVEWPWMLNGGTTFSMGWTPESGFLASRWDHYCELMMLYLLAIASPTQPVPVETWNAWTRPPMQYQGLSYIFGDSPLFTHQYSHAWFDFRNRSDAHANYFDNSLKATQAHKLFCLSLAKQFPDYSDTLWGITSSDSARGYVAWGGPPAMGPIDGTIVPAAAAGSLPFLYGDTTKVLRTIRGEYGASAWKRYGFVDAFNPLTGWCNPDVIGIDQGISMLMAENVRTGAVWQNFMKNSEVQNAMTLVGFH